MNDHADKERLVLLFGLERGRTLNITHAFVKPLLWDFFWHLNRLFVQAVREEKESGSKDMLYSFVQMVGMMMAVCNYSPHADRAAGGLLNMYFENEPEKAQVLIELSNHISNYRCGIVHLPMQFDSVTGVPETPQQAAERLLCEAARHQNRFTSGACQSYAEQLVDAGILTEEEARGAIAAAIVNSRAGVGALA